MRYQAALALPLVAAAFRLPPGRPRPWRDASLCLLAGAGAGGLLVAYNQFLYDRPTEAVPNRLALFSVEYLVEQIPFFTVAFMAIWPAMLLAPVFDRSPLRWLVRGVCMVFLVFFSLHHFHDSTPNWLETLVIGPRLFQVILPVWIVSYAGVVDDWVAAPARRWLGNQVWTALAAACCASLLLGNAMIFKRHQDHLNDLRRARDAVIAAVPDGSLVVANNVVMKLLGIPSGLPAYRLRLLEYRGDPFDHSQELEREERPWYLAVRAKEPGAPLPGSALDLAMKYQMSQVSTSDQRLALYVARPPSER